MNSPRRRTALLLMVLAAVVPCRAQQTIFNLPSADVLDRGQVYVELDVTARPHEFLFTATPRVVLGAGHGFELGVNLSGLAAPDDLSKVLAPTAKWRVHEWKVAGWSLIAGDTLFLPVTRRTFDVGNYVYVVAAKRWRSRTRVGLGAYEFTPGVVANAHRAGGQFTFEQPIGRKVQFAAEWMTGDHASGYFTPGLIWQPTPRLALYGAYQLGNHGLGEGNHTLLVEVGYTFR